METFKVFISYSTRDQTVAGMVCQAMEQEHIPCWIAPRNVPAGENAFEAIPAGIAGATVLVFILSETAMQSDYVLRELQLALHYKKVIIPFRVEDIQPEGAVHFMLTGVQWMDAFVPPLERHIAALVKRVAGILESEGDAVTPAPGPVPVPRPQPTPRPAHGFRMWVLAMGCVLLMAAGGAAWWLNTTSDSAIHQEVAHRLRPILDAHTVLLDCDNCAASQPHVNVGVEHGNVTLTGTVPAGDGDLIRSVPLDVRGVRSRSDLYTEMPRRAPAEQSATVAAKPRLPAAPVAAKAPEIAPAAAEAAAPVLTSEQYRARAAVLSGQQMMRIKDYVSAENYFRLAASLDPTDNSARAGLAAARKALGEDSE